MNATLIGWVRSMFTRQSIDVIGVGADGYRAIVSGVVDAIQAEDGSGNCYNVTLSTAKGSVTVFVRLSHNCTLDS